MLNPRRTLPVAIASAIGAVLIWLCWALPVAGSLDAAVPHPLTDPLTVRLEAGERAGVWMNSPATAFETFECAVADAAGDAVPTAPPPALEWSDVLWWASEQPMFAQVIGFTARQGGDYTVRCSERTGWYDGEILIARDSFGDGAIGLGRAGGADFAVGTILAFCAVVLPLLAVLLGIATAVAVIVRASRRRY